MVLFANGRLIIMVLVAYIAKVDKVTTTSWYVHGDVKPENFLLRQLNVLEEKKLFLVHLELEYSSLARLSDILEMVANMKFDEEPNHKKLVLLFDCILGPNPTMRFINIDGVEKLIRREGELDVEEDEDDQPKKKSRLGMPVTQWITTFTTLGGQMKQRYHYDVADSKHTEYVESDNEDSLYISSVASCTNL
uniref:DUF7477 domain-containing protein n=1 Tax=Physcomitrium patens TaxID=3218 RepID=A0A2K1KXT8_PHYPA|nr:hypothetical protein PHYPA_005554 [Physcomitrium patens]